MGYSINPGCSVICFGLCLSLSLNQSSGNNKNTVYEQVHSTTQERTLGNYVETKKKGLPLNVSSPTSEFS